jgi:hypothetical protein
LGEGNQDRRGELHAWSLKDHIAHVTYWREVATRRLQSVVTGGEAPPPDDDFLQTNDLVFRRHRDDPWEKVLRWAYSTQEALIAAVESLDDEQLSDPGHYAWTDGRPLWQHIALGEGYHPYAHLCDLMVQSGEFNEAESLQVELCDALSKLDTAENWQGNQMYNLACFYALQSRPGRAVELLTQSFEHNPGLIDWSREDSDLDSLRDLPEFQALFPA